SPFDITFDGSRTLGIGASYDHAGLVFARFADAAGAAAFPKLFTDLQKVHASIMEGSQDTDNVFHALSYYSGLTREQLEYPGKNEYDVTGVVSRISRPENNEDVSANVVTNYIQNGITHYFASTSGSMQSAPIAVPTSPSAAAPAVVNSVALTL